jgi:hypothetical protein
MKITQNSTGVGKFLITYIDLRKGKRKKGDVHKSEIYQNVIIDLTKVTKDSATSWALLFECLFGDIEQSGLLDRHAKRLLRSQLKLATKEMQERSKELFERMLAITS